MKMEHNDATTVETTEVAPVTISASMQLACHIAAGRVDADPSACGINIIGAKKDLNCKGRGEHWYRMMYRRGAWQYVSSDRLPNGCYRASERRAEVHGEVYLGEIVVRHNRGAAIDEAYLVDMPESDGGGCLEEIVFHKRRDGNLTFVLPDGSEVVLSNPRST
jgi:hypothetical protein